MMIKKFRVTQRETWIRTAEVDADSGDEALAILKAADWTFETNNVECVRSDVATCEEITLAGEAARAQERYSIDMERRAD